MAGHLLVGDPLSVPTEKRARLRTRLQWELGCVSKKQHKSLEKEENCSFSCSLGTSVFTLEF